MGQPVRVAWVSALVRPEGAGEPDIRCRCLAKEVVTAQSLPHLVRHSGYRQPETRTPSWVCGCVHGQYGQRGCSVHNEPCVLEGVGTGGLCAVTKDKQPLCMFLPLVKLASSYLGHIRGLCLISAFWVHCRGNACKSLLWLWQEGQVPRAFHLWEAGRACGLVALGVAVLLVKKKLLLLLGREMRRSFPMLRQPWHKQVWTDRGCCQPGLVLSEC